MSTSRATRSTPNKTVWEEISGGAEVIHLGDCEMNSRVYAGAFNFKGTDQQKKVGPAVGRRAQPRPHGQAAEVGRQRAAARRTDQRPRRGNPAGARSRHRRLRRLRRSSSATTASSSTASAPTSSPSRATRMWNGSRATSRPTRKTRSAVSARCAGADGESTSGLRDATPESGDQHYRLARVRSGFNPTPSRHLSSPRKRGPSLLRPHLDPRLRGDDKPDHPTRPAVGCATAHHP